eukprot:TRINITY_DN117_c0_g4_i1.p1 TRINITY_DN117_c0_g4~~TRINITY_DN117_c0_g4_i1.p1  ORF type:complete len:198 (+),score=54.86 TRINITY_DN117_c0_g4_i1:32-625(+)
MATSPSESGEEEQQQQQQQQQQRPAAAAAAAAGAGHFECNICLDAASEPIVTPCGHLFCWPCIYRWLNMGRAPGEQAVCPVCKSAITADMLVPLYGRGQESKDPRHSTPDIPERPAGRRVEPEEHRNRGFDFFGPPVAQFGNFSFSAGVGFPFFGFAMQSFGGQPRGEMTREQQQREFLSKLLFVFGIMIFFSLLLY